MSTESPKRPFDVVLYGATGFTGGQTARYFAKHAPAGLRWAVAGRNRTKLETIQKETGAPGLLVADSQDAEAVDAMVQQTRVMLSTAGPFAKYGDHVVDACVRHQTDYVDITGETVWAKRMIDRHHEAAAAQGTRIIPFCGFDSIPSDIGARIVVDALKQRGQAARKISASFKIKGGFNGGTLASALEMAESGDSRKMADPLLLNPADRRDPAEAKRSRDLRTVLHDADRDVWLTPFIMASVNTRVVRRSNALEAQYGDAYGPEFTYQEAMEARDKKSAMLMGAGLGSMEKLLGKTWGRSIIKRFGPSPGEGPSEAAMDGGFMRVRLVGEGVDGARVLATLKASGDPGNRITVFMLCESALALALDRDQLPGGASRGGVLTPATALGDVLVERLKSAGLSINIQDL
ncbi:MAG: short subunit dehydrogenase-like uncharacterized protein [Myxococcota bacterium]|jgi:short subunit dehydrogenase-like uncharacterized protein